MNDANGSGLLWESSFPPSPVPGAQAMMLWYSVAVGSAAFAFEGIRTALEIQRQMGDIGRTLILRQQDELLGALHRSLESGVVAQSLPPAEGLANFAQLSLAAYERSMAAAMAAFDPNARDAKVPTTEAEAEPVRRQSAA